MGAADQLGKIGGESDGWRHARLIPTTGTRSQQEQEKRATSCLLAVMHGVPEFGHALLHELGAPKAPVIETFAEVRLKDAQGKTVIPDGAIVCRRAGKAWTALVEVKTGSARLKDDQVTSYVDAARANGFDGVLTISTQITASVDESPVTVSGVKLRSVCLWHLSWWRILTEAVVQQRYRKISDPDQEWVLRELIHYLSNEASGAFGFEDMGESWVPVRKAAHDGTLRHTDPGARDVAERWEQFTQYLALSFSQELGAAVTVQRARKKTTGERIDAAAKTLASVGMLDATLRVPDAIGPLKIRADLRARQTLVSVTIDAPTEGQLRARFSWLLKQLSDAPDDLLIEATFPNARVTTAAPLGMLREDPKALFYPPDPKRLPRTFTVSRSRTMGHKRGRAEGSFVRETSAHAVAFYRDQVQELKPWQAKAPKVREPEPEKPPVASTELVVAPPWGEAFPSPTGRSSQTPPS
jgi:hypothetical protein